MKRLCSTLIRMVLSACLLAGAAFAQDADVGAIPDTPKATKDADQRTDVQAPAATFVVNNSGDGTDINPGDGICETSAGNGVCTLRAAVVEANALAGNDIINFTPGISLIPINGQISITSNLEINGPGPNALTIQNIAPASATSRVFNVGNFLVSMSGLTITGGNVTGMGGGILNVGGLGLRNCVITGNDASSVGGGIRSTNILNLGFTVVSNNRSTASTSGGISFAGTELIINGSTITGNTSSGNGGGMNVSATTTFSLSGSTVSNNTAGASSGGLFLNRGTISNTTISGNTANGALATDGGGGVRIQAGANTVVIRAVTITGNTAPNSAAGARSGIWHETGTVTMVNSIVAANVAQDIQRDGTAVLTNEGFNLIGENTSVTTEFPEGLPNGTSYVGTDAMPLDPMIAPLAYNGGPSFTHALLPGSVAIDKGSTTLIIDQRSYFRPFDVPEIPDAPGGIGKDIGAFEFGSIPFVGVFIGGRVTDANGSGVPKARVTMTDAGGGQRHILTSPFGYFEFEPVASDEIYAITVEKKGLTFAPRGIAPTANISNLDFMALQ